MPCSMIIPLPIVIQTINLNTLKLHLTKVIPHTSYIHATITTVLQIWKNQIQVQHDGLHDIFNRRKEKQKDDICI